MPGAIFALLVLFGMNLLNYVDRYIFNAVSRPIMDALELKKYSDFAYLATAFMVVYTLVSPVIGWMGDRYHRRRLLAFGVGLWSIATLGTAFARTFNEMFVWRAILGVGEASYGIVAPTLLADLFPIRLRGRVMGIFYLALPLGAALGYRMGGWTAAHLGWRPAFMIVSAPGLLLAGLGLIIPDPGRGVNEGLKPEETRNQPRLRDYLALFQTPSYLFNILGLAAVTFTTGAIVTFGSAFFQDVRHLSVDIAGKMIGNRLALGGLLGIGIGMWLPDLLRRVTRRAYLLWAALAVLVAVPFGTLGILTPQVWLSLNLLFVAMVFMASVQGPCNTVPANVIPPQQRAAAYAVMIFLIHLLGDILSPILIGLTSGWLGRPAVAHSFVGATLARLGATTVGKENLTGGMLIVVPVLLLGVFFFLLGSRYLPADEDREHSRPLDRDTVATKTLAEGNGRP